MECQTCGADLNRNPLRDVDDGHLNEVVAHKYDPNDSVALSEVEYYCNPECAAKAFGGDE